MSTLSNSVTAKIQKDHIKPIPKWKLLLKNSLFWGLFALASLLGAAALSVILLMIFEVDFELFGQRSDLEWSVFLTILPFLWIIFFGLFTALSIYGTRHTKKGYRYTLKQLLLSNFLISIFLGGIFFLTGGADAVEYFLAKKVPAYRGLDERKIEMWSQPEEGLLAGHVIEITDDTILILEDFSGTIWRIDVSAVELRNGPNRPLKFEDIPSDRKKQFAIGRPIKLIGEQTGANEFKAAQILPWLKDRPLRPGDDHKIPPHLRPNGPGQRGMNIPPPLR